MANNGKESKAYFYNDLAVFFWWPQTHMWNGHRHQITLLWPAKSPPHNSLSPCGHTRVAPDDINKKAVARHLR